jgi:hypothetical protein
MRTSPCTGLHGLQERCAPDADDADRVDSRPLRRQERFLAQLVGTNRPTVSVLVSARKAGIPQRGRSVGDLADRNRLKEAACECYDIIRANYEAVGR